MSADLLHEIRQSKTYATFKTVVETVKKRVDLDRGMEEALSLHAGRLSRNIRGERRYSPKILIDASLQDLSYRSRLVEIRVKNDLQLATLREAIDAMRRHISTEYSEDLRDFATAEQRRSFVDRVLKNQKTFLAEGEAFIHTLDSLIKDIDQGGYNLKAIVECLKLLDGSKSGRVV